MILCLPPELWNTVADMAESDRVSEVCGMLRSILGTRRYMRCNFRRSRSQAFGWRGGANAVENVRSVHLRVQDPGTLWDPVDLCMLMRQLLSHLKNAPLLHAMTLELGSDAMLHAEVETLLAQTNALSLHTLNIHLGGSWNLEGNGAQALAPLKYAHSLYSLTLSLAGTGIGHIGAQALAELRSLHTLILNLAETGMGDEGAQALAQLKNAPSMYTLILRLCKNGIGDSGAQALAELKDAPLLNTLRLDLVHNRFGDTGAQAIAQLKDASLLHTLSLSLAGNGITDEGAKALVQLKDAPSLHTLCLGLACNGIGDSGAQALAELRDAALLNTLSLDLAFNCIGDKGAQAVAQFKTAALLHTLSLSLGNAITDEGAQALVQLKDAPSLHTLCLGLACNGIGDSGAQALAEFKDAPLLNTLSLDLAFNYIGSKGAQMLAQLVDAPLVALSIQASSLPPQNMPMKRLAAGWGRPQFPGPQSQGSLPSNLGFLAGALGTRAAATNAIGNGNWQTPSLGAATVYLQTTAIGYNGAQRLALNVPVPATRTLRVSGPREFAKQMVTDLKRALSLNALNLDLDSNLDGDNWAWALAALSEAPSLHTLMLNLPGNAIGDKGAKVLARLKCSLSLCELMLNLQTNVIGDEGAKALAALKAAPSLHTLNLDLGYNYIANKGAQALAVMLKDGPSLRRLTLGLQGNEWIGDSGVHALRTLSDAGVYIRWA